MNDRIMKRRTYQAWQKLHKAGGLIFPLYQNSKKGDYVSLEEQKLNATIKYIDCAIKSLNEFSKIEFNKVLGELEAYK